MSLLATPPTSRKRTRRTSGGAFLSRNEFRVLELVAPCPAIARQTVKEALLSKTEFSSSIEPSGFAIVVTPTRLLVWNALRPECPPVALAFDAHEIDSESSRRVILTYAQPDQKVLSSVIYAQKSGLFLNISVNGKQQRSHLPLNRGEYVTACCLAHPLLCVVALSSHRLLRVRLGSNQLKPEHIHAERSGASFLGLVGAAPSPSPYRKLVGYAEMRLFGITENAIEELIANETASWSLSFCSAGVLEDALGAVSGASKASIVDVAVAENRIAILTSAPVGPLDQLQFCVALYEHRSQESDITPVYRAQSLDSLEADPGETLRVELSDQDIALVFVYGRRSLSIFDLSSGIHDCVRFDEPMLLGGGRAHDHRGCFFVSAANGIICARLARGPTTVSLAYSDDNASATKHVGLFGAFNAFQQARIAKCRHLVADIANLDINDEAVKISHGILDSGSLSLQEKQSRHASFAEFLNSMPTSTDPLWNRINLDVQKLVLLHCDSIEMALSFQQILCSPAIGFHEIHSSARKEMDLAREVLLPASNRCDFFTRVSAFTKAFRRLITSIEKFETETRVLLLVVLCRAVRVIFSSVHENVHPDSWLFESETRDALRRMLRLLRDAILDDSSLDFVQNDFAYSNFFYMSCVLLSGYLFQFSALQTLPDYAALRSALDVDYINDRTQLGRQLIELAASTEMNVRQRYALAFEFGERFTDCSILTELCERCQWPERSDAYAQELGDSYALACCAMWYNEKKFEKLLAHAGQPWLAHFVEDKPRLSWIVDLDQSNFAVAGLKLQGLAHDESVDLQLRMFYCAMAKLAYLRLPDCSARLGEVNKHLCALEAERRLYDKSPPS